MNANARESFLPIGVQQQRQKSVTIVEGHSTYSLIDRAFFMHVQGTTLLIVAMLLCGYEATAGDLLVPTKDAPRYELSNLRSERNRFGQRVVSLDFKRIRKGKGSVSVGGKSADGDLSISASVSTSRESGTISLSSIFPGAGSGLADVELYFVQSLRMSATTLSPRRPHAKGRRAGELVHLSFELDEIFRDLGIVLRLELSPTGKRIRSVLLSGKTQAQPRDVPGPRP